MLSVRNELVSVRNRLVLVWRKPVSATRFRVSVPVFLVSVHTFPVSVGIPPLQVGTSPVPDTRLSVLVVRKTVSVGLHPIMGSAVPVPIRRSTVLVYAIPIPLGHSTMQGEVLPVWATYPPVTVGCYPVLCLPDTVSSSGKTLSGNQGPSALYNAGIMVRSAFESLVFFMVIFDTNILIELYRGNERTREAVLTLAHASFYVSAITVVGTSIRSYGVLSKF